MNTGKLILTLAALIAFGVFFYAVVVEPINHIAAVLK